jgi:precorrin-2 methylase
VFIDRFLLVLAGAERVSATVIVKDERNNRQVSETFVAEQGMNTIRFRERLRTDSAKVIVLMGQDEGVLPYTYDAWVGFDLLERIGGARG